MLVLSNSNDQGMAGGITFNLISTCTEVSYLKSDWSTQFDSLPRLKSSK